MGDIVNIVSAGAEKEQSAVDLPEPASEGWCSATLTIANGMPVKRSTSSTDQTVRIDQLV